MATMATMALAVMLPPAAVWLAAHAFRAVVLARTAHREYQARERAYQAATDVRLSAEHWPTF